MNPRKAIWLAHQRRRWMLPDPSRWLEPDQSKWARPEPVWRAPQGPAQPREQKYQAPLLRPENFARLGRSLAVLRRELACVQAELLARKAGFNPDQSRVPAGSAEGGQWTDAGGASGGETSGSGTRDGETSNPPPRLYVAAGLPRIPRQRPPSSSERTAIAKATAIWLAENAVAASEAIARSSWLYHAIPYISSYLDAPKTLEELQQDVFTPKTGYDRHHIVEQSSAEEAGYPRARINAPENLVRIPKMKHWEINAWYQRGNFRYGDVSPREYLRGKDWDERRKVGLEALIRYRVLKP